MKRLLFLTLFCYAVLCNAQYNIIGESATDLGYPISYPSAWDVTLKNNRVTINGTKYYVFTITNVSNTMSNDHISYIGYHCKPSYTPGAPMMGYPMDVDVRHYCPKALDSLYSNIKGLRSVPGQPQANEGELTNGTYIISNGWQVGYTGNVDGQGGIALGFYSPQPDIGIAPGASFTVHLAMRDSDPYLKKSSYLLTRQEIDKHGFKRWVTRAYRIRIVP